jgi:CDP-paratose 2-epimerase
MRVLITGGAGFIGSNTAVDLAGRGDEVVVLDDLSRAGTEENLTWITAECGGALEFVKADVRDGAAVHRAVNSRGVDAVIHLAAQVAVTSSVADPRTDFDINALGTLNVLEAARAADRPPAVLFASTNKVYGSLEDLTCAVEGERYVCELSDRGVGEQRPLDFHSPYGCSKGAADQYVRDYARIYGLRTVVLRQSCIYGNRQFGIEDQGWLAWFTLAALSGRSITVYGDGRQVRDVLEIGDLVRLYRLCLDRVDHVSGCVFNVGGGPGNAVSILESLSLLEGVIGRRVERGFSDWRPGDQKIFISDNREAGRRLGWRPEVGVPEGLERLVGWIGPNLPLIQARVESRSR